MKDSNTPKYRNRFRHAFWEKRRTIGTLLAAIVGCFLTTVLLTYKFYFSDPHDLGIAFLIGMVSLPSFPLLSLLDLFRLKTENIPVFYGSLFMVFINTVTYAIIGFIVGCLVAGKKNKI